ncbi:hypothetical protein ACQ4LE_004495 [Meloidogyne hapla]
MEYSNIEICLKFKNKGNYDIILKRNSAYDQKVWFRFPLKIEEANKEECVPKMFWKIDVLEKNHLQNLRKGLSIYVKESDKAELENDKMTVYNEYMPKVYQFVLTIIPIVSKGSYEFYIDKDGITKEKLENKTNNIIVNFMNYKEENPNKKRKLF